MTDDPARRRPSLRLPEILGRALDIAGELTAAEAELPVRLTGDTAHLPPHLRLRGEGRDLEAVFGALREVVLATPSAASPRFLNQLFGGRDPLATAAEMLAVMSNISMYTLKAAGPQILLEREVLDRLAALVGFVEGEGMLSPGGSMSNLTAMMLARNQAVPSARDAGLGGVRATIYTSAEGHYSIVKNAGILGLGRDNVRLIPVDRRGRMVVSELARAIAADRAAGRLPVMVNATAGTTVIGAFDPVRDIAEVAREHGLWFHVDGALGASVALSPRHRHRLDGIELADSVTWNPHKILGVPLQCSAVLVRRRGLLWRTLNESATYLFQADVDELNPGTRSIQCGRRNDALKLWATWLYHGDEGLAARVDHLLGLARHAADLIRSDPDLELCLEPELVNVCFRVRGCDSAAVCDHLDQRGRLKIGHGTVDGDSAIRLVCVNPDLDEAAIAGILAEIKNVARELREG